MKKDLILMAGFMLLGILLSGCDFFSQYKADQAQLKYERRQNEIKSWEDGLPDEYLKKGPMEIEYQNGLFTRRVKKVRGSLMNTAMYTDYSNIVAEVSYYSENDVLLSKEMIVLDISVRRSREVPFEFKPTPKDFSYCKLRVCDCVRSQK